MSSQFQRPRRTTTIDLDPLSAARIYYGESHRKAARVRTYSAILDANQKAQQSANMTAAGRRSSHDERGTQPRKFVVNVEETLELLLEREDIDQNYQITIDDKGPKVFTVGTAASGGYNRVDIRGNYAISNLLQELTLAQSYGRKNIVLDEVRLNENPVLRLSRLIKDEFWPGLTRRIDGSNIEKVGRDPKDWTDDPRPRIYIPKGAPEQYEYYTKVAKEHPDMRLDVQWLQEPVDDDDYVRDLNKAPGLLAVAMEEVPTSAGGEKELRGVPFVVPGGRFNELYGWDSYMESLGLILNGRVDLAQAMVKHFCFCIQHYGKILNANRTYYLCRSQPPFLTDMALRVYEVTDHLPDALPNLKMAILAAIKEYNNVWMSPPRLDEGTGLSRYRAGGFGVPPETEASHFVHVLTPYAEKHGLTFEEFVDAYNNRRIVEPELDEYFLHDRAVRESGHDTSYRLEKVAANLATVDLNSLLYKYEADIAQVIRTYFNDRLPIPPEFLSKNQEPGHIETSSVWDRRSRRRRLLMDKFMWNEEKGMYFDYDTVAKSRTTYECATTFWPMWAGIATPRQAAVLVETALPKLEAFGGLLSGTEESRGRVGLDRPNRQWDYPFGWAPQQILAWVGLKRYKFDDECSRLCYRWCYMVTKAFVDFNGVVVEKYDVTRPIDPHKVEAEYGNQGADFKGVAREGFGWVNASYVLGLSLVTSHMRRALGAMTPWDSYEAAVESLGIETFAEESREFAVTSGELSPEEER